MWNHILKTKFYHFNLNYGLLSIEMSNTLKFFFNNLFLFLFFIIYYYYYYYYVQINHGRQLSINSSVELISSKFWSPERNTTHQSPLQSKAKKRKWRLNQRRSVAQRCLEGTTRGTSISAPPWAVPWPSTSTSLLLLPLLPNSL